MVMLVCCRQLALTTKARRLVPPHSSLLIVNLCMVFYLSLCYSKAIHCSVGQCLASEPSARFVIIAGHGEFCYDVLASATIVTVIDYNTIHVVGVVRCSA